MIISFKTKTDPHTDEDNPVIFLAEDASSVPREISVFSHPVDIGAA